MPSGTTRGASVDESYLKVGVLTRRAMPGRVRLHLTIDPDLPIRAAPAADQTAT